MTAPTPYVTFPGTTRKALTFYVTVFGGAAEMHTFAEFGRTDGPGDAIAHGVLGGPVALYASDAAEGEQSLSTSGLMLALLGAAEPATLRDWFARLSDGGTVVDPLQEREWGASDGQVIDRFGVHWLIGYEHDAG